MDPVDFEDIYRDYPLKKQRLDFFARMAKRNLLVRLKKLGLKKKHSILDYGCGNGIFIRYLKERGYARTAGHDPFIPSYARPPEKSRQFDFVVLNDTIEHREDFRELMRDSLAYLKPGGAFYIGTPDTDLVDMRGALSLLQKPRASRPGLCQHRRSFRK